MCRTTAKRNDLKTIKKHKKYNFCFNNFILSYMCLCIRFFELISLIKLTPPPRKNAQSYLNSIG